MEGVDVISTQRSNGKLVVLVVEKNSDGLCPTSYFADAGYAIIEVSSFDAAMPLLRVRYAEVACFVVALLDETRGLQLCDEVHQRHTPAHKPLITFVTDRSSPAACFEHGVCIAATDLEEAAARSLHALSSDTHIVQYHPSVNPTQYFGQVIWLQSPEIQTAVVPDTLLSCGASVVVFHSADAACGCIATTHHTPAAIIVCASDSSDVEVAASLLQLSRALHSSPAPPPVALLLVLPDTAAADAAAGFHGFDIVSLDAQQLQTDVVARLEGCVTCGVDTTPRVDAIVIGSGTSNGVPLLSCITADPITCVGGCEDTLRPGSKNRRSNTCLLLRVYGDGDGAAPPPPANVLIDAGKYFWNAALHWFPHYSIPGLDAVILTHPHMDAIGGLDDLRDFSKDRSVTVYCDAPTLEVVTTMYPYIVEPAKATGGGFVPTLTFEVITPGEAFSVCGLSILPFYVEHGDDFRCLAFRIGDFVYMSDVSRIPDDAREHLRGVDTCFLDCLWPKPRRHASHFGINDALQEVETGFGHGIEHIPRSVYFTGMAHHVLHDRMEADIVRRGFDNVRLAYDGQFLTDIPVRSAPSANL